jgi:hypothetical protein
MTVTVHPGSTISRGCSIFGHPPLATFDKNLSKLNQCAAKRWNHKKSRVKTIR